MGYSITAFSARLIQHMKSLGAVFNDEERKSFMAVWRYTGYLMGIPETILFQQEEDALELFEIARMCEPAPDFESIAMANSLVNSAPLVIGITAPHERRHLAKYVYSVSRPLIGNRLADELKYPWTPVVGVLPWFRLQNRFNKLAEEFIPRLTHRASTANFKNFTSLLEAAAYDDAGISYRLPDHAYAEESSDY